MKQYTRVLTIAGSDSGGCAGIQADIKTIQAMGCYAASAVTALTAQNTMGVKAVMTVDADFLEQQMEAVLSDIGADAVKIGMLSDASLVARVADVLERRRTPNVVLDPVLVATSGDSLSSDGVAEAIMQRLVPLAAVTTPNRQEAERLTGCRTDAAIWNAFRRRGCRALLLKGGHTPSGGMTVDRLFEKDAVWEFRHEMIDTVNTHGTGCSLSSAVASRLAIGDALAEAVRSAVEWEVEAIRSGAAYSLGSGHGPLDHFWAYRDK